MSVWTSKWRWLLVPGLLALLVLYAFGKKSVHHEITIEASPQQVWAVLSDLDRYPDWNPVMIAAKGELLEGGAMEYTFRQDAENEWIIAATVRQIEPPQLLNQVGGIPGVLTYNHRYQLEAMDSGAATRVIIHEAYRGIAVPFWNPAPVGAAYARLNAALKQRVEGS